MYIVFFLKRYSVCSFGSPGIHNVDQAGLEITEIPLPLLPESMGHKARQRHCFELEEPVLNLILKCTGNDMYRIIH